MKLLRSEVALRAVEVAQNASNNRHVELVETSQPCKIGGDSSARLAIRLSALRGPSVRNDE